MAYTPPAGDAAHFTWLDAAAYTAPAGDAAHLAFAPDAVPYTPLTPPTITTVSNPLDSVSLPTHNIHTI